MNKLIGIILFFFSTNVQAIDVTWLVKMGDSLMHQKQHAEALKGLHRAFFFSDSCQKTAIASRIAANYFYQDNFAQSRAFIDSSMQYNSSDSLQYELFYQKVLTYIKEDKYQYAQLLLDTVSFYPNVYFKQKWNLYKGVILFGMEQYATSFNHFKSAVNPNDTLKLAALQQYFAKTNKLKRPYPNLALVFSLALPGAGQLYTGDVKNATNSAFLVGALVYLAFFNPVVDYFLIVPFIYRYYLGGAVKAKRIAIAKRNKGKQAYYHDIMRTVLHANQQVIILNNKE